AQAGVAIARGERGRDRAARARARHPRARVDVVAVILGLDLAGEIDLGAGDMTVDVDAARHHHHAGRVDALRVGRCVGRDLAGADADVPGLPVHAVGGVVHAAIADPQRRSHRRAPPLPSPGRAGTTTPRRPPERPPEPGSLPTARAPGREWRSGPLRRSVTGTRTPAAA